jgi:hypothetical protein
LDQCKNVVFSSPTLALSAKFSTGPGGLTGAEVTLTTGSIDSTTKYNAASVGYLTVLGISSTQSLTPGDTC